jgi:hypothetical protein
MPGWKVVRQGAPWAATAQHIQNSINDITPRVYVKDRIRLDRWNQGLEDGPLGVRQIGWIRLIQACAKHDDLLLLMNSPCFFFCHKSPLTVKRIHAIYTFLLISPLFLVQ